MVERDLETVIAPFAVGVSRAPECRTFPPPLEPGTKRRLLGGGSEAAESASDACLAARAAFVVPGGRPRRRAVGVRYEGVMDGAIASNAGDESLLQLLQYESEYCREYSL
jgi:hypothetical protein